MSGRTFVADDRPGRAAAHDQGSMRSCARSGGRARSCPMSRASLRRWVREGRTEREVAATSTRRMRRAGLARPAFPDHRRVGAEQRAAARAADRSAAAAGRPGRAGLWRGLRRILRRPDPDGWSRVRSRQMPERCSTRCGQRRWPRSRPCARGRLPSTWIRRPASPRGPRTRRGLPPRDRSRAGPRSARGAAAWAPSERGSGRIEP